MKSNIVLIGMPGAGKSTIGVILAKSLLKSFIDTDLLIQGQYCKSLCDIIEQKGTDAFLKIENDIIKQQIFNNAVVATGGSAVYGEEAMKKLKENSIIVYLSIPISELQRRIKDIHTRGVAMKNGTTLEELFAERKSLYEKYADIVIDCEGLTPEQCVDKIAEAL